MGFLSKAWSGVKKVVKKAARTAKKLAKKVAYALPGGKKLWDLSSKIGKGAMKVVGKVANALGPVGMIAISVLAPYAAPLWASFGAASAAAGGLLGSVGTAVYTAGNWVAGTLGSMTSGISKALGTVAEGGLSGVAEGSLSKAASQAANGFAKAFTGEAGKAGVKAGVQAATKSALAQAAGQSVLDQTTNKIMGDVGADIGLDGANQQINANIDAFGQTAQEKFAATQSGVAQATDFTLKPQAGQIGGTVQGIETQAGNIISGKTANQAAATAGGGSSLLSKAGDVAKGLLNNTPIAPTAPLQAMGDPGGNRFAGDASARGGVGSGGGNFLSQSMLQAMQQQQQRMTRGFG